MTGSRRVTRLQRATADNPPSPLQTLETAAAASAPKNPKTTSASTAVKQPSKAGAAAAPAAPKKAATAAESSAAPGPHNKATAAVETSTAPVVQTKVIDAAAGAGTAGASTAPSAIPKLKPGPKAGAKSGLKTDAKLDAKSDAKLETKIDAKPESKTGAKTGAKSGAKSGPNTGPKAGPKAGPKNGPKTTANRVSKPKDRAKTTAKSAAAPSSSKTTSTSASPTKGSKSKKAIAFSAPKVALIEPPAVTTINNSNNDENPSTSSSSSSAAVPVDIASAASTGPSAPPAANTQDDIGIDVGIDVDMTPVPPSSVSAPAPVVVVDASPLRPVAVSGHAAAPAAPAAATANTADTTTDTTTDGNYPVSSSLVDIFYDARSRVSASPTGSPAAAATSIVAVVAAAIAPATAPTSAVTPAARHEDVLLYIQDMTNEEIAELILGQAVQIGQLRKQNADGEKALQAAKDRISDLAADSFPAKQRPKKKPGKKKLALAQDANRQKEEISAPLISTNPESRKEAGASFTERISSFFSRPKALPVPVSVASQKRRMEDSAERGATAKRPKLNEEPMMTGALPVELNKFADAAPSTDKGAAAPVSTSIDSSYSSWNPWNVLAGVSRLVGSPKRSMTPAATPVVATPEIPLPNSSRSQESIHTRSYRRSAAGPSYMQKAAVEARKRTEKLRALRAADADEVRADRLKSLSDAQTQAIKAAKADIEAARAARSWMMIPRDEVDTAAATQEDDPFSSSGSHRYRSSGPRMLASVLQNSTSSAINKKIAEIESSTKTGQKRKIRVDDMTVIPSGPPGTFALLDEYFTYGDSDEDDMIEVSDMDLSLVESAAPPSKRAKLDQGASLSDVSSAAGTTSSSALFATTGQAKKASTTTYARAPVLEFTGRGASPFYGPLPDNGEDARERAPTPEKANPYEGRRFTPPGEQIIKATGNIFAQYDNLQRLEKERASKLSGPELSAISYGQKHGVWIGPRFTDFERPANFNYEGTFTVPDDTDTDTDADSSILSNATVKSDITMKDYTPSPSAASNASVTPDGRVTVQNVFKSNEPPSQVVKPPATPAVAQPGQERPKDQAAPAGTSEGALTAAGSPGTPSASTQTGLFGRIGSLNSPSMPGSAVISDVIVSTPVKDEQDNQSAAEDSQALAKVRSSAQKYKPKRPSTLREANTMPSLLSPIIEEGRSANSSAQNTPAPSIAGGAVQNQIAPSSDGVSDSKTQHLTGSQSFTTSITTSSDGTGTTFNVRTSDGGKDGATVAEFDFTFPRAIPCPMAVLDPETQAEYDSWASDENNLRLYFKEIMARNIPE